MKKLFILLTGITLFATSCTKEESIEPKPVDPGGDSDSSVTINFLPSTKDTYLKMKITSQGSAASADRISTLVSTGQKSAIDGIDFVTWKEQESGQTNQFGYKDHNLYTKFAGTSPTGESVDINFIYLNDTASVGYKWTRSAGIANGLVAYMPGEIIEKNITKQIQGKTYTNVTHTRVDINYNIPGYGEVTLGIYDFYIANNIGIVKVDTRIMNGMGAQTGIVISDLIEYSIK